MISGICQTKRKLGGKVFQSLPIVNGSVLDNIGGHEIGQVRSLQVAGDQINGCMEFFDYGGYRPVVNGVVINKIENHEIVDVNSCHVVGDKINGIIKFADGTYKVVMSKRVLKLEG